MLQRFTRHGKRAWPVILLILVCTLSLNADEGTRAHPLRHPTSRPPGEGWTSGPLVDANAPRRTPWDHPYVDVEAANSMDNLHYGNLDNLNGYGGYFGGGFGMGWGWSGGYTMGWFGLPY